MRTLVGAIVAAFVLSTATVLAGTFLGYSLATNFGQPTVKLDKFYEEVNGSHEVWQPAADVEVWQTDWPHLPGLTGSEYRYWAGVRIYEKTNTFYNSRSESLTISSPGGKAVDYSRPKGGTVDWIRIRAGSDLKLIITTQVDSELYSPDAGAFEEANRIFDEFKTKYRIDELVAEYIRTRR